MATKHYELADGVAILSGAPLVHYEGPCVVEADIDALPEWDALRGCVVDLGALDERDYLHVALSRGLAVIVDDAPVVDEPALADTVDIDEQTDTDEG